MTKTEIEQAIEDIIEKLYCKKYNRKLEVIETFTSDKKHLGYILKMDLNKPEKPYSIAMEGDLDSFLKFVEKQLKIARLNTVDYFEGIQCTSNINFNEECNCK